MANVIVRKKLCYILGRQADVDTMNLSQEIVSLDKSILRGIQKM